MIIYYDDDKNCRFENINNATLFNILEAICDKKYPSIFYWAINDDGDYISLTKILNENDFYKFYLYLKPDICINDIDTKYVGILTKEGWNMVSEDNFHNGLMNEEYAVCKVRIITFNVYYLFYPDGAFEMVDTRRSNKLLLGKYFKDAILSIDHILHENINTYRIRDVRSYEVDRTPTEEIIVPVGEEINNKKYDKLKRKIRYRPRK